MNNLLEKNLSPQESHEPSNKSINNSTPAGPIQKVKYNTSSNQQTQNTTIIVFNIIIGQILALIGIGNATLSKVIEKDLQYVTPFLLTSSYYFLLGFIWLLILRKIKWPRISYIIIILLDSQANFLNIYAFSVVHFNYPFIINVSAVFWTCLLTWIFIRRYKYAYSHIIGLLISIIGVTVTLYGTLRFLDGDEKIFDNVMGLLYCLAASILYSISAVLQEIYFKSGKDIYEFFPWLGIIGCVITFAESFLLSECHKVFYEYTFTVNIGLLWFGFSLSLVLFTSIAPFFIKRCSASMFNISLVSQIFWSYLVEVCFGDAAPKGYEYYIGFVVIILGIFIFNKYPVTSTDEEVGNERKRTITQNLLDKETAGVLILGNGNAIDNKSETSSTSAFSAEKKYSYYRNPTISNKANKYLNNA